ncbi:Type 4 pili biogenesis protein pilB (nuleotide-binding protein) [Cupriavidus gilardii]|nr:Type 4 pili biogenesis protein pilB (nuleotide-binding protein) [Cupriavidus gilardii]
MIATADAPIQYDPAMPSSDGGQRGHRGPRGGDEVDDAPVVRFVQKLLSEACRRGASDLHFEPYEGFYRVRFRIDGLLHEVARPPLEIRDRIATRIKVLARLDIAEKRVPQDGRMRFVIPRRDGEAAPPEGAAVRAVDLRVSTLPTLFGEKIVLRMLDASSVQLDMDALGFEAAQLAVLLEGLRRPHGMVLVTGPTGSGKTVSLYAFLNLLNQDERNIATAEDPAEIQLAGINQVNINDKVGLGFPTVLRALLRQDPDVIMVGEIRDAETADIAVKAAQTGHLVLSTLHTNDAPSTLTRLAQLGTAPFHLAASVLVITAQRLARMLCVCKRPGPVPLAALREAGCTDSLLDGDWQPCLPVGCAACRGSGYRGRCGIHQVMPVSDAMQGIILSRGSARALAQQARREGVLSLREAGLLKVRAGTTSLAEVLATTNP